MEIENTLKNVWLYIHGTKDEQLMIVDSISKNSKILDVGCAGGHFLINLRKFNKNNKIGIDIYKFLNKPSKDFEFLVGDIRKMPIKSCSFNFIYCRHVIEHVNKEEGSNLLKEFLRILEKNGIVFIVTPNRIGLTKILKRLCKKIHIYKILKKIFLIKYKENKKYLKKRPRAYSHKYEYSPMELISSIEKHFNILRSGTLTMQWYSFVNILALINRFLPWRCIEFVLKKIDRLVDLLGLWQLKYEIYVIAQKRSP